MRTGRNFAAIKTPQSLLKGAGHMHLDRCRRDAYPSPGRARGLFDAALSSAPIGMALIDMDGCWLQVSNALYRITFHEESELTM